MQRLYGRAPLWQESRPCRILEFSQRSSTYFSLFTGGSFGLDRSRQDKSRFVLQIAVRHCDSIGRRRGITPGEMNAAPLATWLKQRGPEQLFREMALHRGQATPWKCLAPIKHLPLSRLIQDFV